MPAAMMKLTQQSSLGPHSKGNPVYVLPEAIAALEGEPEGTMVYLIGGRYISVTEQVDLIVAMLEKANAT